MKISECPSLNLFLSLPFSQPTLNLKILATTWELNLAQALQAGNLNFRRLSQNPNTFASLRLHFPILKQIYAL